MDSSYDDGESLLTGEESELFSRSDSLCSDSGSPLPGFVRSRRSGAGSRYLQQVLRNSFDLSWTFSSRSSPLDATRVSFPDEEMIHASPRLRSVCQHNGPIRGDEEAQRVALAVARRGRANCLAAEWDRGSCSSLGSRPGTPRSFAETTSLESTKTVERRPEVSVQKALSALDPDEEERKKDIDTALAWIRHELVSI